MTLLTTSIEEEYDCNGVTTAYPTTFKFATNDQVLVVHIVDGVETVLVLNTDYTVTGRNNPTGGTVTTDEALASGRLRISRVTPMTQITDLRSQSAYNPEVVETAIDRVMQVCQEIAGDVDSLQGDFDSVDLDDLIEIDARLDELETRILALEALVAARIQCFVLCLSDRATPITAGTKKGRFFMPYNFVPVGVTCDLGTAQTSGSAVTVDCNVDGVTMLSTKCVIANGSKVSATEFIDVAALEGEPGSGGFGGYFIPAGAEVTFDLDQVGDGTAVWLQATLRGYVHVPELED